MTKAQVLERLKAAIAKAGTQKAWAVGNDVAESHLSDVLNGRREPGPRILDALGLKAEVEYTKVS